MTVITDSFRDIPDSQEDVTDEFRRITIPVYDDNLSEPRKNDPSDTGYVDAGQVALQIFTQGDQSIENDLDLSALWIFWGQFLDHDIDLTPGQTGPEAELLKDDDSVFDLDVMRSVFVIGESGVAEQQNIVTPFIDASNVYGSTETLRDALRTFEGGLLKTSTLADGSSFLPTSDQVFNDGVTGTYVAGDVRAQENTGLTAIQATFVNEHNYWAGRIAAADPSLTDEEIFQQARAVVEALIQKISYEEFLPVLLGDALPAYDGYVEGLDVQISNEFATAAYRFGHTSIPEEFAFLNEDGTESREPANLFDIFNDATTLEELGIDDTLRGLLEDRSQKIDTLVVDSLNLFLFTPDGGMSGFSLPERNILRGRDHGIDTYINVRAQLLGDINAADYEGFDDFDFSVITSDPELQQALADVYGTVDLVDLWVGGLAEDYAPGVTIGATFQAILIEQFARLRDGDPLFYLNRDWANDEIFEEILDTSFADVLMRSSGIEYVQRDALLASDRIGGSDGNDTLNGEDGRDLIIGFAGNDRLYGEFGDDDLFGGTGSDRLMGGRGDDALSGEGGKDRLAGGAGDDILSGGDGHDVLIGGAGYDNFVFQSGESEYDVIRDFDPSEDLLVFKGFGAEFSDLSFDGKMQHRTLIFLEEDMIAKLDHVDPDALTEDHFIFIA
jgi:peroxidase